MSDYRDESNIATNETDRLIASNKVEGTSVYGQNGEKLGHIYNFMVDKREGRVEYAVLAYGGLFGIGESHYPLPWNTLTYDTEKSGYRVNLDRDRLHDAPSYKAGHEPDYDAEYGRRVHDYYGVTGIY